MAYTNIDDPSAYFQTATYAGNGGTQSITNDGNSDLQPDLLWIKSRSDSSFHAWTDSTRGTNLRIYSNSTAAEESHTDRVTAFNSDGFSLGSSSLVNTNAFNYVAWQWKANGGTTSSNTDGTGITSTVQANQDAGFSIVTYTGIGSGNANPSVGHGLGVTPQVVLVKSRSQAISWIMYHYGIDGANSRNKYLLLDTNGAAGTLGNYWGTSGSGGVTSSTFGVYADNQSGNNYLNGTHIAYCFAEKQGYSKFGKYVGNGNASGPFVYTGFKPAFVLLKNASAYESWVVYDTARNTFNLTNLKLSPDTADSENDNSGIGGTVYNNIDILSNGFKCRSNNAATNASANTIIYMAFAESPFTTSTGIPTTAR